MLRALAIHEMWNGFMLGYLNALRRDIALWWKLCFLVDYSFFPLSLSETCVCIYLLDAMVFDI